MCGKERKREERGVTKPPPPLPDPPVWLYPAQRGQRQSARIGDGADHFFPGGTVEMGEWANEKGSPEIRGCDLNQDIHDLVKTCVNIGF